MELCKAREHVLSEAQTSTLSSDGLCLFNSARTLDPSCAPSSDVLAYQCLDHLEENKVSFLFSNAIVAKVSIKVILLFDFVSAIY